MTSSTHATSGTFFEVHHFTLCDGWTNCWSTLDENGQWVPETFPTREAAQAAIDEFLADIAADIAAGDREPEDGYDASAFAIVAHADGPAP